MFQCQLYVRGAECPRSGRALIGSSYLVRSKSTKGPERECGVIGYPGTPEHGRVPHCWRTWMEFSTARTRRGVVREAAGPDFTLYDWESIGAIPKDRQGCRYFVQEVGTEPDPTPRVPHCPVNSLVSNTIDPRRGRRHERETVPWPWAEDLLPCGGSHPRAEADPPQVACPRLLAWSMGCSEHIIGDAHGVIPFRRVFTRRIPALRCSFDITEPRSEP